VEGILTLLGRARIRGILDAMMYDIDVQRWSWGQ
jgi:hypothetical protein